MNFITEHLIITMEVSQDGEPSGPLFRPSKRRKFYRKRVDEENGDDDENPGTELSPPDTHNPNTVGSTSLLADHGDELPTPNRGVEDGNSFSIADLIRQRKLNQRKRVGVEFNSSLDRIATPSPVSELALIPKDETPEVIKAMGSRFAQQTGRVTEETNLHMYDSLSTRAAQRLQRRLT